MNEDSRGLRRRYKEGNFVPKSQDILYGRNHKKKKDEIGDSVQEFARMYPGLLPCALGMHLGHAKRHLCAPT